MPDEARQAGPGPLSSVQDPVVARELRNLWSVVTARSGQTGSEGQKWVTIDELNAAKREVLGKMPTDSGNRGAEPLGGGSNTSVTGGGGVDLLPLDNIWTGTNTWVRRTRTDVPTLRVQSMFDPSITPAGGPTIMLNKGYQAALDVRKTSSAQDDAVSGGGNAAIYVQHRVDGQTALVANVNCGIRVQMESWQRSTHATNDVVAGYFGLVNHGLNSGGFGVHVDTYHWGSGNTVTYGMSVELFRAFSEGKVIGFHCRQVSQGDYTKASDWAFLASPQPGGGVGIKTVFAGGSDYTGQLQCDYGLDLAYATCQKAAIRVPANTVIQLNGTENNVGLYFNSIGRIQFFAVTDTIAIGNDGSLRLRPSGYVEFADNSYASIKMRYSSAESRLELSLNDKALFSFGMNGTFGILNPEAPGTAGKFMGYVVVNLGGFNRKIPFYDMS